MTSRPDDGDDDAGDDSLDDDTADDEEVLLNVERAFRAERARIRATSEVSALRSMREEYEALAASPDLCPAGRIRIHDLIELVDDRVTDINAISLAVRLR